LLDKARLVECAKRVGQSVAWDGREI